MRGPEQKDDHGIYCSELQAKILEGKKAIADGGYCDKKDPLKQFVSSASTKWNWGLPCLMFRDR